jgi:DNA-directed RNA polymerase specialized sigma subunit
MEAKRSEEEAPRPGPELKQLESEVITMKDDRRRLEGRMARIAVLAYQASEKGATLREMANVVGVTRQRVAQLVNEGRDLAQR